MNVAISAIREYFEQFKVLRLEHNIPSSRIFNADEIGILLSPDLSKSIEIKGKSLKLRASETHEQLTMMVTVSATGEIFSPLFIWREKSVMVNNESDLPPKVLTSTSPKGFITREIFAQWIAFIIQEAKISPENQ